MSEEQVRCPFCNRRHRVKRPLSEQGEVKGEEETVPVGKILGVAAAAAGVAGLAAPIVANAGLKVAGFTGTGIKKDSAAASMHSGIGTVKKDSGFANVQSLGAKGGFSQFGLLALGAAAAAGAAALGYGAYQHHEDQQREREEQIRIQNNICEDCWKVHRREFTAGGI